MSNEVLVRKFFDAYNEGNAAEIVRLFSDSATIDYAGGVKDASYKGKKRITGLFQNIFKKSKEKLGAAMSHPRIITSNEGVMAIEWVSVISSKSGASFTVKGVNVAEVENDKFSKMTVYMPTPMGKPFALADKLTIKDLGELSMLAWAIV